MDIACSSCGALHWMVEKLSDSSKRNLRFGTCCMDGKVQLPPLQPPPEPLQRLLTSNDADAVAFREVGWKYNRAFSFTSLGVSEDRTVNEGFRWGPPVFRICGDLCHRSGALTTEGEIKCYAQLWVLEPRAALEARMDNNIDLDQDVMHGLQTMLGEHHQYVSLCF
ncbi:hypothetical protein K443DRAFT_99409 [Laccaria amethystina LaAM-08-1]|uniref:Uncharacterized protein n=1 Tax=Laccaria amethystina LaAM-08-1 TaxID=1095629 RepID=A0A0C9XTC3_9AGAR|nr:hypothetical protein K443DRAFT_99409 [Laccaria amethystina LaAM-08-1]